MPRQQFHSDREIKSMALQQFEDPNQETPSSDSDEFLEGQEEFVLLFARYHSQIYARVLAMVGSKDVADDVFQEASLALWQSFSRYDSGRSFLNWATGIARNHVKMYFRSHRRVLMTFDDDILKNITRRMSGSEEIFQMREEMLRLCLDKLPEADRKLLRDYHLRDHSAQALAVLANKSLASIYRRLNGLKERLFKCVDAALKSES